MFDNFLVRSDSLENVTCPVSGEVVGFKFGVRLANYRGIYLSLVNGFYVNMDGVEYGEEDLMLEVNGQRPRTMAELAKCPFEHWDLQDEAMLHVKKPGGLAQGYHDLKLGFCFTSSYMPPIMQSQLDPDKDGFFVMPEFGHHVNERRLLIV